MDPDTHARAREHFIRLLDMADADRPAALDALISAEPEVGRYVAELLGAQAPDSGDLFEDVVKQGFKEKIRDMAASLDLPEGERINSLTIVRRLDGGGFGDVYLAHQDGTDRTVALKIIKAGMDTAQVLKRFEAERRMLAALEHPNIARLYDAGHTPQHLGSRPYFAMEYVDGPRITQYCDDEHSPLRKRIEVFIDACKAVQHAHSKLIIHRDLKPSNILVASEDGKPVPKVIDFGIAKALDDRYADTRHTLEGQVIGTLDYMSPEQADGSGDADVRTDVYALGVVLYELLTGTLPFDTHNLGEMSTTHAYRIIREVEPKRPSTRIPDGRALKEDLDWITQKCLAKEPDRRYQSVGELIEDLQNHLVGRPVRANAPPATYRMRKYVKRNWLLVSSVSAAVVVAVAAMSVYVVLLTREANTRVERDEYQSKVLLLEETNTRLEASEARTQEVNGELQARNAQLARTQSELESKNAQLEEQSVALRQAVDETTRLAQEERQAREEAEEIGKRLADTNADLKQARDDLANSLKQTEAERDRAQAAEAIAKENERRADDEAKRAEAAAQNFQTLYDQLERSVRVLTQGDRIPTDVLAQITDALDSAKLLQAQILERLSQRASADADLREAVALQRQAVSAFTEALGSDHRNTLRSRLTLTDLFQRDQNPAEAAHQIDLLTMAAARSLDPADPLVTDIELARATGLLYRGQLDDALTRMDSIVAELESTHGIHDLRTLKAVRRRAMTHAAMENFSDADADYRRVLTLSNSASDEGLEEIAIAANNLAVLVRQSGRDDAAEALFTRALGRANVVWGETNWRTAMVQAQHASVLAALGRFETAERKLLDAYDVLASTLGRQHRETLAIARELLFTYEAWDESMGTNRHAGDVRKWQRVLNVPR